MIGMLVCWWDGWDVCRAGKRGDGGVWRRAKMVATRRIVPGLIAV